jgi:hypothetical protein
LKRWKTCERTWSRLSARWGSRGVPGSRFIAYIGPIDRLNGTPVATPNYGYEKRQKELAKKRKKEDKLKAKAERKQGEPGEGEQSSDGSDDQGGQPPSTPAQS